MKTSGKQTGDIKIALQTFAENRSATLLEARHLPIGKVTKSDQYGGLCFVSEDYFDLILQLKYIFVKTLITSMLCVLQKDLIEAVYQNVR